MRGGMTVWPTYPGRIERAARRLCALSGTDPDAEACRGHAVEIPGRGYCVIGEPIPAWRLFVVDAEAMAEELREL